MADDLAGLDAFIARLEGLSADIRQRVAKEAVKGISNELKKTAAAGTTPYGEPWPLRVDGTRAMPDAASAILVRSAGPTIKIEVRRGAAIQSNLKGERRRRVIPEADKGIPESYKRVIAEALARVVKGEA